MDFSGFFKPYPKNRPLIENERKARLLQGRRLDIQESDDLSVIRLNDCYMELVDKWFPWRGIMTTFSIAGIFGGIALNAIFWIPTANGLWNFKEELHWIILAIGITSPFFLLMLWFLKTDAFRYTHYPIRLNRRNQMVHVFRTDGTILSAPWRDLFFCIASLPQNNWEIQGHVLDKDGATVKETFAFPVLGTGAADREQLPRYWEFVRRYMEEGPHSVAKRVEYCLPIADRRESFTDGFHRTHGQAHALFAPLLIIVLLFIYILPYPGRWVALRTSKLPVWPKEIEDSCVIEPDDPYRKDASTNQPINDHSLIYLVAACGIGLLAWVLW